MDQMILITKADCPNCEYIKKHIPEQIINNGLRMLDADKPEGMSHIAYYEIYDIDGRAIVPALIVDEEAITGTIKIRQAIEQSI